MKLTLQTNLGSGPTICATRMKLARGKILYQSQPGDRYETITLKGDEELVIEDEAAEVPVRKPASAMLRPMAPHVAAVVAVMTAAGCGLVHAGSVRSPMMSEIDAPLPLWLAIPCSFFALAFFYLATVKLSDNFAARRKTKSGNDRSTPGSGPQPR